MAKQTLKQALHLGHFGESRGLALALHALDGCPVGGWGETAQARRQIAEELPRRIDRSYTLDDFVDAAYEVDHADRYRAKF